MGDFPSGQRGQTVNLLATPSVVRIHHPPPKIPITRQGGRYFYWVVRWSRSLCPEWGKSTIPHQKEASTLSVLFSIKSAFDDNTHSVGATLAAARMVKPLFRATARVAPTIFAFTVRADRVVRPYNGITYLMRPPCGASGTPPPTNILSVVGRRARCPHRAAEQRFCFYR